MTIHFTLYCVKHQEISRYPVFLIELSQTSQRVLHILKVVNKLAAYMFICFGNSIRCKYGLFWKQCFVFQRSPYT